MSLDLETVDRDVYNALDWVRELGGFTRGLRSIFSLVLIVLTYNHYESYMISELFQREEKSQEKEINSMITAKENEV